MACGEVGLNIDYFYGLTPREFDNILTGYRQKEEAKFRTSWETARFIVQVLISPNLKKGRKFEHKFPWEEKVPRVRAKTAEEILKIKPDFEDPFAKAMASAKNDKKDKK